MDDQVLAVANKCFLNSWQSITFIFFARFIEKS